MARREDLRASDEDRERVVERLHRAATEGRIAAHELEHRVAAALKARTYADLDETTRDLPGPPRRRGRREPRPVAAWALSAVRANPMLLLFALPALAVTAAMLLAATIVWLVLMVVVLVLGGRPRGPRPPWLYGRRYHHELRGGRRTGGRWA